MADPISLMNADRAYEASKLLHNLQLLTGCHTWAIHDQDRQVWSFGVDLPIGPELDRDAVRTLGETFVRKYGGTIVSLERAKAHELRLAWRYTESCDHGLESGLFDEALALKGGKVGFDDWRTQTEVLVGASIATLDRAGLRPVKPGSMRRRDRGDEQPRIS